MALTPETLPRHELIGLPVRVVDAANPDLVGIEGRVRRETAKTLVIEREGTRAWQVQKEGTTFEFALADETADDAGEPASRHPDDAREGSGIASEPSGTAATGGGDGSDGEGVTYVTVDGARLLSRPARRTERTGDSTWR